jgi:RNA polymerase sigma-70 factor (ECF subfamily)
MAGALAVADDIDDTFARARAGDPAAFAALVRAHQAMVFSLALHALRSRPAAEDVAQDVFVALYRALPRIESAAHAVAWLRRVTCHRAIDELRRPRRRFELATGTLPDRAGPHAAPEPPVEPRLRELVAALPPLPRMVVLLRYQEELEPAEIAAALKMSINTVKSHLRRSLETLRRGLES